MKFTEVYERKYLNDFIHVNFVVFVLNLFFKKIPIQCFPEFYSKYETFEQSVLPSNKLQILLFYFLTLIQIYGEAFIKKIQS